MVYLPNEIINLILYFREINPVSFLIKDSVEKCPETYIAWVDKYPYYILSSLLYQKDFLSINLIDYVFIMKKKIEN